MSLINDMLRNLDGRRPAHKDGDDAIVVANYSPRPKSRLLPVLLVAVVLVVVAVVTLNNHETDLNSDAAVAMTNQGNYQISSSPASNDELVREKPVQHPGFDSVKSIESPVLQSQQVAQVPPEPELTSVGSSGKTQSVDEYEIELLLQQADRAVLRERLVEPDEDNAYDRYQRVLSLVPNHPAALEGIDQIVTVYLDLAGNYLNSGDAEYARVLMTRAMQVGGQRSDIVHLNRKIAVAMESAERSDDIAASNMNSAPVEADLEDADPVEIGGHQNSIKVRPETVMLEEVEGFLAKGADTDARHLLEQYLIFDPESLPTVHALFNLYLRLGDTRMAQRLLDSSPGLPTFTVLELSARVKIQEGDLPGAIRILETATPELELTSYHALQASLYQREGQYREASDHYRNLVEAEPGQGVFWLGLAVALDSLHDDQEALTAFLRTRDTRQYDGDVGRYVDERIRALSK